MAFIPVEHGDWRPATRQLERLPRVILSQTELPQKAGVHVETLNRVERAKINASPATMEKLDAVLNQSTKDP
jgi:ribosome-binding protein aMBF1 (putative translation factor)